MRNHNVLWNLFHSNNRYVFNVLTPRKQQKKMREKKIEGNKYQIMKCRVSFLFSFFHYVQLCKWWNLIENELIPLGWLFYRLFNSIKTNTIKIKKYYYCDLLVYATHKHKESKTIIY